MTDCQPFCGHEPGPDYTERIRRNVFDCLPLDIGDGVVGPCGERGVAVGIRVDCASLYVTVRTPVRDVEYPLAVLSPVAFLDDATAHDWPDL